MASFEEKVQRILKEIDLSDPHTLSFFGASPQRRLAKLSAAMAAQDTVTAVSETDTLLQEVTDLLSHKGNRWIYPLLRAIAILPIRTPEERYKKLQRRMQANVQDLQQLRMQLKIWRSDLSEIIRDLKAHSEAATRAMASAGAAEPAQLFTARIQDLGDSLTVSALAMESLKQREIRFSLLTEQLQTILGTGTAAWHVFRAQLQATGETGVNRLRKIAQSCQQVNDRR